jgi:hypothetical protein
LLPFAALVGMAAPSSKLPEQVADAANRSRDPAESTPHL